MKDARTGLTSEENQLADTIVDAATSIPGGRELLLNVVRKEIRRRVFLEFFKEIGGKLTAQQAAAVRDWIAQNTDPRSISDHVTKVLAQAPQGQAQESYANEKDAITLEVMRIAADFFQILDEHGNEKT